MDNILIVFLKYPEPGRVKTRLAKDIRNEKACHIYKLLAENVIRNIFRKNQRVYDIHIFFTPSDKENGIRAWMKPLVGNNSESSIYYIPQEGANLGERMYNAFMQTLQGRHYRGISEQNHSKQVLPDVSRQFLLNKENLQEINRAESATNHNRIIPYYAFPSHERYIVSRNQSGDGKEIKKITKTCHYVNKENNISSRNAIIIGTDCPGTDAPLIEHAFELLKEKDIVIGPCKDGGYYLLGMSRLVSDLFADIPWSTDRVFDVTMGKIQKNNLSCSVLKTLADIDRKEDL